jgi:cold shock CspA family protein
MRTQGTLIKWNDERGFGFAKTRDSGIEVFAHISEFPPGGRRPGVGDPLSFEIVADADGRKRARAIVFEAPAAHGDLRLVPIDRASARASRASIDRADRRPPRAGAAHRRRSSGLPMTAFVCAVLAAGAWFAHREYSQSRGISDVAARIGATAMTAPPASPDYRCDGRQHCSQMRSCAEATWFVRNCPDTKMDGDHDGLPCEQDLCR